MDDRHMAEPKKTLLLILDGWGIAPDGAGNCVRNAATPHLDRFLAAPWACPTDSWATPRWAT
jgi:2,3-bisphosphoglycerate-independent phosphoglycerate mutase